MLQVQDAKAKGSIFRACLEDTEGQSLQNLRDAGTAPVPQVQHAEDERQVLRECLEKTEGPHLQAMRCKIARPLAVRGLQRKVPDEFVLAVALEQSMQNKE